MVAAAALSEDEATDHGFFAANEVKWGAGPPSLPSGAKAAVLEGDPTKAGLFTMRLSLPDGYQIKPHTHPAFEHITVISGTFNLGMGEKFDTTKGKALETGAFAYLAPKTNHYAWSKGETVIQLHGEGPWQINYLNPADDPRKK
jgi:quercetin dioxygenase-like cupin family protein